MNDDYIRVEGSSTLFRDKRTGAIVNFDKAGYKAYLAQKRANEMKRQEHETMRFELDILKNDVGEIKDMLRQLLEKK